MTATLKRSRALRTKAMYEMTAINSFTLIRECAMRLALATPQYRRARHCLTGIQLESMFLDGVPTDPDFTKQRTSLSNAARETRAQLCSLAVNLQDNAGAVLRDLTRALSREHDGASAEQFGEITEIFAAWHACERLLGFGELIQSPDFPIPSDATLDAINANLAMLLASLYEHLSLLGFEIPPECRRVRGEIKCWKKKAERFRPRFIRSRKLMALREQSTRWILTRSDWRVLSSLPRW